MSAGYTGEIRMFGGDFAPHGWASCDGTLMAISQFPDLYKLIGITYGGDGVQSFQLPDMRGRIPVHAGTGTGLSPRTLGDQVGEGTATISGAQMPVHTHSWEASTDAGTATAPQNATLATTVSNTYNTQPARLAEMSASMVGQAGDQQPHNNMMPSVGIRFIICLFGDQPSQT